MTPETPAKSTVRIFLDEAGAPLGEFTAPVSFELNTSSLPDGPHVLKILSRDPSGREGVRLIPFVVRNGPAIDIEGLKAGDTVDGTVPVLINAYGEGDQRRFLVGGSETPRGIPSGIIVLLVAVLAWAAYYAVMYFEPHR